MSNPKTKQRPKNQVEHSEQYPNLQAKYERRSVGEALPNGIEQFLWIMQDVPTVPPTNPS